MTVGFRFTVQIVFWLWITVLFANFAEAVAEGRGKAQAATLRKARTETSREAPLPRSDAINYDEVAAPALKVGDLVLVESGDLIPSDGEIVEGIASVDESAITGESAPVIRESGGDRSAVTGGTRVLSDWIKVRITAAQGSTFLDRMIALVEGAQRQKTPNEIALNILLAGLTIIFVFAVATHPELCDLRRRGGFGHHPGRPIRDAHSNNDRRIALGHRHRRHGPPRAVQCPGNVRSCGRGSG